MFKNTFGVLLLLACLLVAGWFCGGWRMHPKMIGQWKGMSFFGRIIWLECDRDFDGVRDHGYAYSFNHPFVNSCSSRPVFKTAYMDRNNDHRWDVWIRHDPDNAAWGTVRIDWDWDGKHDEVRRMDLANLTIGALRKEDEERTQQRAEIEK